MNHLEIIYSTLSSLSYNLLTHSGNPYKSKPFLKRMSSLIPFFPTPTHPDPFQLLSRHTANPKVKNLFLYPFITSSSPEKYGTGYYSRPVWIIDSWMDKCIQFMSSSVSNPTTTSNQAGRFRVKNLCLLRCCCAIRILIFKLIF